MRVAVAPAVDLPVVDVALRVEVAAQLVHGAVDQVDHRVLEVLPAHLAQHLLAGRVREHLRDRLGMVRDHGEGERRRAGRRLVGCRPVVLAGRRVRAEAGSRRDAEAVPEQARAARAHARDLGVGERLPVVEPGPAVDQRHLAGVAEALDLLLREPLDDVCGDAVPARHDHVLAPHAPALRPVPPVAVVAVVAIAGHVVEHVVDRRVLALALGRPHVEDGGVEPHADLVGRAVELVVAAHGLQDAELVRPHRAVADIDVRERVRDQPAQRQPQQRGVAVRPGARRPVVGPRVLVGRPADPRELDLLGVAEADALREARPAEDPAVGGRDRLAAGPEQAARAAPVLAVERLVVHADVVAQVLLVGDRGQVGALLLLGQRRAGGVGEEVLVRGLHAQDRVPGRLRVGRAGEERRPARRRSRAPCPRTGRRSGSGSRGRCRTRPPGTAGADRGRATPGMPAAPPFCHFVAVAVSTPAQARKSTAGWP